MKLTIKGRPTGEGRPGVWALYDGLPMGAVADAVVGLPPPVTGGLLWTPFVQVWHRHKVLGVPHLDFVCRLELDPTHVPVDFLRVDGSSYLGRDLAWSFSLPEGVYWASSQKLIRALEAFAKDGATKWISARAREFGS